MLEWWVLKHILYLDRVGSSVFLCTGSIGMLSHVKYLTCISISKDLMCRSTRPKLDIVHTYKH